MRNKFSNHFPFWTVVMLLCMIFGSALQAEAFTLKVVDKAGNPVNGYRWLVEEDTTNVVTPGTFSPNTLGVNIHGTYAPVKLKGHSSGAGGKADIAVDSKKRWFVSVLPDYDAAASPKFTQSGHLVEVGATNVNVVVNDQTVGTAQISVYIFKDTAPINNAPDTGEPGLGDFSILLFDQAGQVSQDAFGNPLGTRYDAAGNVTFVGDGEIITCTQADVDAWLADPTNKECPAVGEALIKYIPPGKYGVRAVGPSGETWIQTSTIEGTPGIDAWVKANEPNRLVEFGPALYHVFMGFLQPFTDLATLTAPVGAAPSTVTGNIRRVHSGKGMLTVHPGPAVEECWIGINALERGAIVGVYAAPCDEDSTFAIPNVPAGFYQIVAWDKPLDYIFFFSSFVVDGTGADVDLTDTIFMNSWFGNIDNVVYYDMNQNGFRDCVTILCDDLAAGDEVPIQDMNINLRWRDGTIYQAAPTDINGEANFNEVFPLFKFYIAEVDFARLKATGATIVTDDGGVIPPHADWNVPSFDKLNPQAQFCTMADIAEGTIADYGPDQIAGTPDDIPCATVGQSIIHPFTGNNLARLEQGVVLLEAPIVYADQTHRIEWGKVDYTPGENGGISGVIIYATTRAEADPAQAAAETWEPGIPRVQVNLYADFNGDGVIDDADGNGKIQLADVDNYPFGNFPGPEDIDRNGNGVFNRGDALNVVTSDSWDDNMPTGCQGPQQFVYGQPIRDCAETLQTWNQIRPGLFDGGYAFDVYYPFGKGLFKNPDAAIPLESDKTYIVEANLPAGYEIVKEEDKNVDFGDAYVISPLLVPPPCVGDLHRVPAELDLFPGIPVDPAYAGQMRPLCTRKQVFLADTQNAAADFHFFTEVPKAARGVGLINNDVALTLDPNNPIFGEKAAASWLPVSVQDFNGNELSRIYTDSFGAYNFLAPSTYTVNIPTPSGVSPNMLRLCLNHPGPIPDPAKPGKFITDPFFDTRFSLVCYTLDFWPAKTTYLDTPIIPVAAYTAVFDGSLDCEFPDGTPVVSDVTGPGAAGPYVSETGTKLTITSPGDVQVTNPDCQSRYDPSCAPLITRDFGFGAATGTVKIGDVALTNVAWSNSTITATVPAGAVTGQLSITRGDNGQSSITGVTVTVGGPAPIIVAPGQSIQAAIDNPATVDGALIIVRPGRYDENIIMTKRIKLQGSSAYSTVINSAPTVPGRLQLFQQDLQARITAGQAALVPGENFTHVELAALTVIPNDAVYTQLDNARIDGLTLTSATSGGGITVNGYAHYLEISNNRIINNAGSFGGGIRVGTPGLIDATGVADPTCGPASETYCSNNNDNITIHNNHILTNGSVGATTGGGGIALYNGADNYNVTGNYVCGNFTTNRGAGIAHVGLSPNGSIANNRVLLNESSFNSLTGGEGGGILVQGEPARVPNALFTPGTGSVVIDANLIQANMAGNGKGGGIFVSFPNGLDVEADPGDNTTWYGIDIFNNIIANNVAGWVGGGIFLQDAAKVRIDHNTIVNNSSTSTGANAVLGVGLNQPTIPQGAGVVGAVHSADLLSLGIGQEYSNPELNNNIIWHNSSYSYDPTANGGFGGLVPDQATPSYWDLQVFTATDPATQVLDPNDTILSSLTGPDGVDYDDGTNLAVDPSFIDDFVYTLRTAAAPGEGGNTVQVSITPISPAGDYHLLTGSPAIDQAAATVIPQLAADYDGETRPDATSGVGDIGADEFSIQAVVPTQAIRLVTPNGGEIVATGSTQTIVWQAPDFGLGITPTYRLKVSYNNGATWTTIPGAEALATTTFDWTIPALNANKKKSRIKVQAFNGTAKLGQDASDNIFEVEVVKILYPSDARVEFNSGVTIAPPFGINWRLNDVKRTVARAKIQVSTDNGATWKKADLSPDANAILNPAEGQVHQQTWTVPNVGKAKTKAKVRVVLFDAAGSVITQDQNDVFFTILPAL